MDREEIVLEFISELLKTAPDDYTEIKVILLCMNANKPEVINFLQVAFALIEKKRTPLIGMKGGAV